MPPVNAKTPARHTAPGIYFAAPVRSFCRWIYIGVYIMKNKVRRTKTDKLSLAVPIKNNSKEKKQIAVINPNNKRIFVFLVRFVSI